MKTLLLAIMLSICVYGYAQDNVFFYLNEANHGIMPRFEGGETAFYWFLSSNIKYPRLAMEKGIQGRVLITFIIEKDGSVSDITLLVGIGGGCDEEALRVVRLTNGKWTPGTVNGDPVRVQFNLPLRFSLDGGTNISNGSLAYNKGVDLLNEGKYDKALSYFSFYEPAEVLYPNAIFATGICKYMMGDTKGAITDWETARDLKHEGCEIKLAEAYLKLGNEYQEEKKYPASIACYSKALENSSNDVNVLFNRGISYLYLGDKEKACQDWRACLELGSADVGQLLEEYCK